MNQFCCGCSLQFGAMLILILNLVQNLFQIATVTSNVILKMPTFGYNTGLTTQTFNAAFCLLGLPFIAGAIWGVIHRLEANVRLYLYYMILTFTLDLGFIISFFVYQDFCETLPAVLKNHGQAFACGFMRIASFLFVIVSMSIELYFVFVMWSLCEDIKCGGSGLPQLYAKGSDLRNRKRYNAPDLNHGLVGGTTGHGETFPVAYGSFQSPGMGGSVPVFGPGYHETNYPPAQKF